MSETIVKSFNIFCDSALGDGNSKGDDYELHLNTAHLNCDKNQFFRFTVKNFSMFKTFPNINATNSSFEIKSLDATNTAHINNGNTLITTGNLSHKNYKSVHSIADEFATQIATSIKTHSTTLGNDLGSFTISNLTPDEDQKITGDTNNIISFTITYSSAIAAGATLKCKLTNDSYALLGGNRAKAVEADSFSSIEVTIGNDRKIVTVQCLYPAQRMTSQFVYLRSSLNSNNLESNSLGNVTANHSNVEHSQIMGRFPIDNEFIQYDSSTGREFIVDVPTATHIQNIRFYLTNERKQGINELLVYGGTDNNNKQTTLGNLNFSFALRVDIIQTAQSNSKFTPEVNRSVYPRFSNQNISTSKIEG